MPVDISSRINVDKDIEVFGRCVDDRQIRIDSETQGLADVFAWIIPTKKKIPKKSTERLAALAGSNYWP